MTSPLAPPISRVDDARALPPAARRGGPRTAPRTRPRTRRGFRAGMSLVEVILAIVILSGTMLGLGNFARKFQSANSGSTSKTLASDLAAQRIADIQVYRPYTSIVATYNGTSEDYTTGVYKGFTRATTAVRCTDCPTATADYITVTVSVTGNDLANAVTKTVIIAAF